eukprot:6301998-Alexandrium_andersonii.AAC.1
MSASLVGSEMCIRDSVDAASPPCSEARACPGGIHPVATSWMWVSCASGPVSYTHLTLPTICSV